MLGHIVLSGLSGEDSEIAYAAVEELEGFDILPEMMEEVTHVVSSGKRTLKVLEGITRGCWVVSVEWITASMEAGHWLDEQRYELSDTFPGVSISRQRRQGLLPTATGTPLFPKDVTVYIGAQTSPHRHFLQQLVTRSGGQVRVLFCLCVCVCVQTSCIAHQFQDTHTHTHTHSHTHTHTHTLSLSLSLSSLRSCHEARLLPRL